jgi:MoaD family protein
MNVKVLYFALARELARKKGEAIDIPSGVKLSDLVDELKSRHPQLEELGDSIRFSVNLDLVGTLDFQLHEGDVIGVLPAVAGG